MSLTALTETAYADRGPFVPGPTLGQQQQLWT